MQIPSSSKTVIIGAGIIGCSTAYHLSKIGHEVVILDKAEKTSGTTWHAAGLVGQLRSNANITQLLGYSIDLYKNLEEETGLSTGWKMNGGLRLACSDERWIEVKRQATAANSFGLEMQLLKPQEAQDLWPIMDISDVVGAAFLPTDGQANPSDICIALSRGAQKSGALIYENLPVTKILLENNKVVGVETPNGKISCEKLVLCCGQWSRDLASTIGVNLPLASVQHQYMITEAFNVPSTLPTLRDPDRLTYYKEEVGGLIMGGYEPNGLIWGDNGIPEDFAFKLLPSNIEHFEQFIELSLPRVPSLKKVGMKQLINGPESFTPDGNFLLGEVPEVANVFVGAGFNAFGIAAAGGAGMALAEWVDKGHPPFDLWPVDICRFGQTHADSEWVRTRTLESYSKHYGISWPNEEYISCRENRCSPLYKTLKQKGAVFGEKFGWERPNWFAAPGEDRRDVYSFSKPNWHYAVAREHKAARGAAALFDQTSFAKFVLKGPDSVQALNWIASNNVERSEGSIIYTQMLNDSGGIECDVICVRKSKEEFYIVTGTGFATHDYNWISKNIPFNMKAKLIDVTSKNAVVSLFGPKSREILSACTESDISNENFGFATAKNIEIFGCPVLALRITFVGELGWELHMPIKFARTVYEGLHSAGKSLGIRDAGYRAIESLRLEKGYRSWSSDIGPDHSPDEAGLGWAVKMQKGIEFKGKKAVSESRKRDLKKMLATFSIEPDIALTGRETIFRNGIRCGWLSSGGFGHWVNKSIGLGYVRNNNGVSEKYVLSGNYELDVAGERIKAGVTLKPLYDIDGEKIKS